MYTQELISGLTTRDWRPGKDITKTLLRRLHEETAWLNCKKPVNLHRILMVKNNITQLQVCKGCERSSLLNVTYPQKIFRDYCSNKCATNSSRKPKSEIAYSDEWLIHQRVILRRSITQISSDLGYKGTTFVTTKIKELEITTDSRRKTEEPTDILYSPVEMYKLYITEKKTIAEIAISLNSSAATVQRFLKKHDILRRAPNSYKRKHIKVSKPEQEIFDFITSIYSGVVESGNRSVLDGRELDIYLPSKQFAIEFNGLYSHLYRPEAETEALRKDRYYHQKKTNDCEALGITLIHIFEDEWSNKKDLFKSMLRSRLELNQSRIFARKCVVCEIKGDVKNAFLVENHAQGQDKSSVKLGLFYEEQLVAVMTFVRGKFNKKDYDWELNRFATLANHTIVGGFSKLLKASSQYGVSGIVVSYADRRYSAGNVYQKNGFVLTTVGRPGYYYVSRKDCKKRFNRLSFTKQKLQQRGAVGVTELEMADSQGYSRIYDCGVNTYTITI